MKREKKVKPVRTWDWSGDVDCRWSMSAGHSAPSYWWGAGFEGYQLPTPDPVELFGLVPANRAGREGTKFRVRIHVEVELVEKGRVTANPWERKSRKVKP